MTTDQPYHVLDVDMIRLIDDWERSILSLYHGTMPLNVLVATLWSIKRRRIVRSVEAFNWWFFGNEVSR